MNDRWRWNAIDGAFAAALLVVALLGVKAMAATAAARNTWLTPDQSFAPWAIENSGPLFNNLWFVWAILALGAWLPGGGLLRWACAMNVIGTLLLLADLVHVEFYGDFVSFTRFADLVMVPSILPSITATVHAWMWIYVADWPFAFWLALRSHGPHLPRRTHSAPAVAAVSCAMLAIVDVIRFGGHLPKGGYDVRNGTSEKPASAPAVH